MSPGVCRHGVLPSPSGGERPTYEDPGWYEHPPGTVAEGAGAKELERDGIKLANV